MRLHSFFNIKRSPLYLAFLVPFIFAAASVIIGRDANWDFLNYRWYNPYAFLHRRLTDDILVAGHATFYNPLLELPFYFAAHSFPAMLAGFILAFAAAVSFLPLFFMCRLVLAAGNDTARQWGAFFLALAGLCGGGVLGQIGIISWDVPLGILTFMALYILGARGAVALQERPRSQRVRLIGAGILAGAAAGLKLTAAIYPVGIAAAIFFASAPGWGQRLQRVVLFSIGTIGGVLLLGGYWMAILYQAFGNPTFPYFNGLFHSPFAPPGSNRDSTFLPQDWQTALAFPFLFSLNSHHVAEYDFRDVHIALAYALLPLAALGMIVTRRAPPLYPRLLMIFFIVSYAVWEALFSIYRYILPLEMMAPLIIFLCLESFPLPSKLKIGLTIVILLVAQLLIRTDFTRRSWEGAYISVTMPPDMPKDGMVLMLGQRPLGYIVPFLPASLPVIRADSGLAKDDRFAEIIDQRLAEKEKPMFAVFDPGEREASRAFLAGRHLRLETSTCALITSNVADPLCFCSITR